RVVDDVVQALQDADVQRAHRVQQGEHQRNQRHRDAGPVFGEQAHEAPNPSFGEAAFCRAALYGLRSPGPLHAWTNCIWVPASSSKSPFLSVTGSAPMAAPLSVGLLLPSTWATTKPWGRLVIAATATPGLPMVVTTFTSGTSRPAAAPESTLMLALAAALPAASGALVAPSAVAEAGAPAGAAAGLAGIGGTMPGLKIMVFSKVAPGASLMNLILYLPISTVSLFCSNCFFTALPLT